MSCKSVLQRSSVKIANSGQRILVIAAHPDDEILGCGGTLAKNILQHNAIVQCVFVMEPAGVRYSPGTLEFKLETKRRRNEALKVARTLKSLKPIFLNYPSIRLTRKFYPELSQKLETIVRQFAPNSVLTHNHSDNNYDHRISFEATMTACRPQKNLAIEEILSYEIPSATDDYNLGLGKVFTPDVFVNIEKYFSQKILLLDVYRQEMRDYPHSRSMEAIDNLAKYRGSMVNETRCEAFQLIRRLIR